MKIIVHRDGAEVTHDAKELGSHRLEVRVRDIDNDGELDAELYVDGVLLGSMPVARLAKNVRAEVRRAVKNFRRVFRSLRTLVTGKKGK